MSASWVKIGYCSETYLCNNCGAVLDFNGIDKGKANYCPNCGEKMIKRGNSDNDKQKSE